MSRQPYSSMSCYKIVSYPRKGRQQTGREFDQCDVWFEQNATMRPEQRHGALLFGKPSQS